MATLPFLTNIDLNGNEILNFSVQGLTAAPSSPTARQMYFNITTNKLMLYSGNEWIEIGKTYSGGNKITVTNGSINHATQSVESKTSTASPSYGGTFTAIDVVTTDDYGHVTKVTTKTITLNKPAIADVTGLETALSGKLDKITAKNNPGIYAVNKEGNQVLLSYDLKTDSGILTMLSDGVVMRDGNGQIYVPLSPTVNGDGQTTSPNQATSVSYVQQLVREANDRIDQITAFGRYLSDWDPTSGPVTKPGLNITDYELKAGDFFIVNKDSVVVNGVAKEPNFIPTQTGIWRDVQNTDFAKEHSSASIMKAGGKWRYDGGEWSYTAPKHHFDLEGFTMDSLGGVRGHDEDGYIVPGKDNRPVGSARVSGWESVVKDDDPRLTDSRTPNSHTHGNITNAGELPTANQVVVTDANKKITSVAKGTAFNKDFGTGNGNVARGDHNHDGTYAPNVHSHGNVTSDGKITDENGNVLAGKVVVTDGDGKIFVEAKGTAFNKDFGTGNSNVARGDHTHTGVYAPSSHTHGNITSDGKVGTASGKVLVTATGGSVAAVDEGTAFNANFGGTGSANTVARSDHNHAGTYAPNSHTHGNITNDGKIGSESDKILITTIGGAVTTTSFGTTQGTVCEGNDSRLSDARTPKAHTHALSDITDFPSKVTKSSLSFSLEAATGDYVATITANSMVEPDVYDAQNRRVMCLITATDLAGTITTYKVSVNAASAPTGWYTITRSK